MGHSKTISTRATSSVWWARLDSNQRPTGYEPGALPLSYGPERCARRTQPTTLSIAPSTGAVNSMRRRRV
jgi:hypothetical protein